jgi:glycosyltransferase involved in cell wall biosynthesis
VTNPHVPLVSIVVPAYNEEGTIGPVLERLELLDLDCEVIVVNDGSSDGTAQVLSTRSSDRVRVHHQANGGKGTALRTGFGLARGQILVVQDSDLELDPAAIPDLIAPIVEDRADVVYGSRFLLPVPGLKKRRLLANKFLTLLTNRIYKVKLTDMETAHKAFRVSYLERLDLTSTKFDIEVELTAKLARCGARFVEIPSQYKPRTVDQGKKITFRDGIHAMQRIVHWWRWKPE